MGKWRTLEFLHFVVYASGALGMGALYYRIVSALQKLADLNLILQWRCKACSCRGAPYRDVYHFAHTKYRSLDAKVFNIVETVRAYGGRVACEVTCLADCNLCWALSLGRCSSDWQVY